MIILGIDPGFDRMGCAVLEKTDRGEKLLYSACLVSDRGDSQAERLFSLGKEIEKIIRERSPDILAIESLFLAKNQKTAMRVAEARGMVLFLAASKGINVREFTPLEIKIALTGYGRAEKNQVRDMVMAILKMEKAPKYDDETDAIACALACSAGANKDIHSFK